MTKLPFVDHPVLCGECGEMLWRKFTPGQDPVYGHTTKEERIGMGNHYECPNFGKKYRIRERLIEVEEIV